MTNAPVTVRDCVDAARQRLERHPLHFGHGCQTAHDEAIWAILHVAGLMECDYADVCNRPVTKGQFKQVERLIDARVSTRKPLAYLLGEAWFAGTSFHIDERAIVPRSHIGDLLQDGFGPLVREDCIGAVLDLCTGSGCIAVAAALAYPTAQVDAADIDESALEVAKINVGRHRVGDRVHVMQSDLFSNLAGRAYDLILCNPPYVDSRSLDLLPEEYRHEPRLALEACNGGTAIIEKILSQAATHLTEEGHLVLEAGESSGALEARYPEIPFFWLTTRAGESVVLLASKADLIAYSEQFCG